MSRKVLAEQGSPRNRLVLALDEYQGHRYLDAREWYLDRKAEEWKPKKRGVTFNRDRFGALMELVQTRAEEIMDWLGVGYVPEHVARYEEAQAQAQLETRYRVGDLEIGTFSERRDPRFFRVEHEGGADRVSFNSEQAVASKLSNEDVAATLGAVLCAYQRARAMLSASPATDPEVLFEQLEFDWARYLSDYLSD